MCCLVCLVAVWNASMRDSAVAARLMKPGLESLRYDQKARTMRARRAMGADRQGGYKNRRQFFRKKNCVLLKTKTTGSFASEPLTCRNPASGAHLGLGTIIFGLLAKSHAQ